MKIVIALDEGLGPGYLANAAACVASGLFYSEEALLGPSIEGDALTYIPITKIPILIMKKGSKSWEELLMRAKKNDLKYMVFTKEGQSTTSYEEYMNRVRGKPLQEVTTLAIGVLGDDAIVKRFCGDLALLR
jgi:hypothetical protein